MDVGSVGGSSVAPVSGGAPSGDGPSGGGALSGTGGGGCGPAAVVSLSGCTPSSGASGGLSTEGFVGLHNSAIPQDPMMESIKKIMEIMMALKLLEALSKPQ